MSERIPSLAEQLTEAEEREAIERVAKIDDVVQIDPEHDALFGACFLVVRRVYPDGEVLGFVEGLPGKTWLKIPYHAYEVVGEACWIPSEEETDGEAVP